MERSGFFACMRPRVVATAVLMAVAGCASSTDEGAKTHMEESRSRGVNKMLEEIYASKKPVGFEQLDVSPIVSRYFSVGTPRADVLTSLREHPQKRVIEDSPETLIVRDDHGQAMLDPDARSVVITFTFDSAGKLAHLQAVHLKNQ